MLEGLIMRTGLEVDAGDAALQAGAERDKLQRHDERLREGRTVRAGLELAARRAGSGCTP